MIMLVLFDVVKSQSRKDKTNRKQKQENEIGAMRANGEIKGEENIKMTSKSDGRASQFICKYGP